MEWWQNGAASSWDERIVGVLEYLKQLDGLGVLVARWVDGTGQVLGRLSEGSDESAENSRAGEIRVSIPTSLNSQVSTSPEPQTGDESSGSCSTSTSSTTTSTTEDTTKTCHSAKGEAGPEYVQPKDVQGWHLFFISLGFPERAVMTQKLGVAFGKWCDLKLPVALVLMAMENAHRALRRGRPDTPAYYVPFVEALINKRGGASGGPGNAPPAANGGGEVKTPFKKPVPPASDARGNWAQ